MTGQLTTQDQLDTPRLIVEAKSSLIMTHGYCPVLAYSLLSLISEG